MHTTFNLPQQLKQLMKEHHMTIITLADQSGISEDTIKAIRTGRIKSPGIEVLVKLADVLDCSIDELIDRTVVSSDIDRAL
ncbi:MAG: helix-turn-helix domain-containing protein [Lachnospiraceae bacterium]